MAKENEELVIAENALQGERLVTVVRLATIAIIATTQQLAIGLSNQAHAVRDVPRGIAVATYTIAAVLTFIGLRRARPSARASMWAPLVGTLFDYAFFTFMGWRSATIQDMFAAQ